MKKKNSLILKDGIQFFQDLIQFETEFFYDIIQKINNLSIKLVGIIYCFYGELIVENIFFCILNLNHSCEAFLFFCVFRGGKKPRKKKKKKKKKGNKNYLKVKNMNPLFYLLNNKNPLLYIYIYDFRYSGRFVCTSTNPRGYVTPYQPRVHR